MTDRTSRQVKSRKAHRASGSRKAAVAISAAATAGMMFAMATAKPAWTSEDTVEVLPDVPDPVIAAPASRAKILLPVPATNDGSLVAPATPQPVQLEPVAAPTRVVTKTVVVKRGGGSSTAASGSATTKSSGSR
jgi:hypothetical protein